MADRRWHQSQHCRSVMQANCLGGWKLGWECVWWESWHWCWCRYNMLPEPGCALTLVDTGSYCTINKKRWPNSIVWTNWSNWSTTLVTIVLQWRLLSDSSSKHPCYDWGLGLSRLSTYWWWLRYKVCHVLLVTDYSICQRQVSHVQ